MPALPHAAPAAAAASPGPPTPSLREGVIIRFGVFRIQAKAASEQLPELALLLLRGVTDLTQLRPLLSNLNLFGHTVSLAACARAGLKLPTPVLAAWGEELWPRLVPDPQLQILPTAADARGTTSYPSAGVKSGKAAAMGGGSRSTTVVMEQGEGGVGTGRLALAGGGSQSVPGMVGQGGTAATGGCSVSAAGVVGQGGAAAVRPTPWGESKRASTKRGLPPARLCLYYAQLVSILRSLMVSLCILWAWSRHMEWGSLGLRFMGQERRRCSGLGTHC